jgi:hypothetical protein
VTIEAEEIITSPKRQSKKTIKAIAKSGFEALLFIKGLRLFS